MLGGVLACGFTHAGITPLDVTKCNMQVCRSLSYLLPSRSTSLFRHCLANLAPPRPLIPTMYSAAYPSPPLSHSGVALRRVSMTASHSRQSISLEPVRPQTAPLSPPLPPIVNNIHPTPLPSRCVCVVYQRFAGMLTCRARSRGAATKNVAVSDGSGQSGARLPLGPAHAKSASVPSDETDADHLLSASL